MQPTWQPHTLEDHLLSAYLADYPGRLFLEVEVGTRHGERRPRRLDGLLVPGEQTSVHPPHSYSREEVAEAVRGATVHLLEAKRILNRNVIGQVEVGTALFRREFEPAEVEMVAVCRDDNIDLRWYCDERDIRSALYPDVARQARSERPDRDGGGRVDVRRAPDEARMEAFLKGWRHAAAGRLYGTIRTRKTHANMGNLFGWIYGNVPLTFREATWERYSAEFGRELRNGRFLAPES
jgi:hypothetical protein